MNRPSTSTLDYMARSQSIRARRDADDIPAGRPFVPVIRWNESALAYAARCQAFKQSRKDYKESTDGNL